MLTDGLGSLVAIEGLGSTEGLGIHSSDKPSDIIHLLLFCGDMAWTLLLLAPTTAMGRLTSVTHCY
jgi:hypothetical protein